MESKRLYKSRTDIKIDGICSGVAKYFNADPSIVRLIWAAATLFTGGSGIVIYIICSLVIPREPDVVDYTGGGYNNNNQNYN